MRRIYLSLLVFLFSLGILHSYSLNECVELALKKNKTVKKAKEEIAKYKESYREVKGHLLPQLSLSGGYQYKKEELPNALIPTIPPLSSMLTPVASNDDMIIAGYIDEAFSNLIPQKDKKSYNLAGKLKLDQVLFLGGKLINGINIAGKLYHLQEKRYFLTKQDIIYNTIDMFYKCILSEKVLNIQNEAYQIALKHLKQVRLMYKQGLVSEYDYLRADLEVKRLKPQLLEAEKNRDLAREAFAKFLNLKNDNLKLEGDIKMPEIKLLSINDALNEGLENRMELKLASIGVDVNKVQLRYQKGNFLPDIGLNAEYSYYATTENSFKKDNFGKSYQIGIGFSMPLFTGFSNSAKIAKARHQLNQAKLDYENLKDMITLDIKNSYKQLKKDLETLEVQKDNIKLSDKALKIAETRYQNQLSDQLEVFDAQLQKKSTRLSYYNAIYKVITDNYKLKKAMGKNLLEEVKNEK